MSYLFIFVFMYLCMYVFVYLSIDWLLFACMYTHIIYMQYVCAMHSECQRLSIWVLGIEP